MPTANWLTPPVGGNIYEPEPEPQGLLGFLGAGPDFGVDVGDRLGVISQILMNLGSGRGGTGIAEATAAVNARSAARRERRKAERMVARMADKLEGSNPEMAAAMRANTEFGMSMLGKMYESEWSSKARLAEQQQQYDLMSRNELALAAQKQAADDAAWSAAMGGGGGVDPWSTPSQPTVAPVQAPTQAPAIPSPVPPTMGAGGSQEPSPTLTPQQPPLPPAVTTPQPAPVAIAPDPLSVMPPLPPLSSDPQTAAEQKRFSAILGFPVSQDGIRAIKLSRTKAGVDPTTVITTLKKNWDDQVRWYREQALTDARYTQQVTDKAVETAGTRAYAEGLPTKLIGEFQAATPVTSGTRGPQAVGQRQPWELTPGAGPSLESVATLRKAGLTDEQIAAIPNPEIAASQYLSGVGKQDTATVLGDIQKGVTTAQTAAATQAAAVQQGRLVQRQVKAMRDTIKPDPRTGQFSVPQQQQLVELDSIIAGKTEEAPDNFNAWREQNRQLASDLEGQSVAREELKLKQSETQLKVDAARDEKEKVLAAAEATDLAGLTMAYDAQENLYRTMQLLNDPNNNEMVHGVGGWVESFNPGSTRARAETYLTSVQSVLATQAIQGMKKQSATGATGLGATNAEEIKLLQTVVTDALKSLQSGVDTEYMLKKVYNSMENLIMPDGGQRFDMNQPGFNLQEFNMKQHNPAFFRLQQRKNTKKDPNTGLTVTPLQVP